MVLEGIDGSGKSTQANLVVEELLKIGHNVIQTGEPSSGKIGVILREYLSDPLTIPFSDALLFAADRVEHYLQFIKPQLDQGKIVICDRYTYSSIVYQGAQGVDRSWIREINQWSDKPDIVFYLKISVENALSRLDISERSNREKFENQSYLKQIVEGYEDMLTEGFVIIDGEKSTFEVRDDIVTYILNQLEL